MTSASTGGARWLRQRRARTLPPGRSRQRCGSLRLRRRSHPAHRGRRTAGHRSHARQRCRNAALNRLLVALQRQRRSRRRRRFRLRHAEGSRRLRRGKGAFRNRHGLGCRRSRDRGASRRQGLLLDLGLTGGETAGLTAACGSDLAAAFGSNLPTAFGSDLAAAFGSNLPAAFGSDLAGCCGSALSATAGGAAVDSATASLAASIAEGGSPSEQGITHARDARDLNDVTALAALHANRATRDLLVADLIFRFTAGTEELHSAERRVKRTSEVSENNPSNA